MNTNTDPVASIDLPDVLKDATSVGPFLFVHETQDPIVVWFKEMALKTPGLTGLRCQELDIDAGRLCFFNAELMFAVSDDAVAFSKRLLDDQSILDLYVEHCSTDEAVRQAARETFASATQHLRGLVEKQQAAD